MDRNTILFNNSEKKKEQTTQEILSKVYQALDEKGYTISKLLTYFIYNPCSPVIYL